LEETMASLEMWKYKVFEHIISRKLSREIRATPTWTWVRSAWRSLQVFIAILDLSLDYYDYMRYAFINQTCNQRREDGVSYRMCSCRGNNFFGLPELKFNTY
jgi:hypothetical protein